jgi:F0F1-type ATP synthase assembly protein I
MPVDPLVVLWGDWGDVDLRIADGVTVLRGEDLREWRPARASPGGDFDVAYARMKIQAWLQKRDRHIRDHDTRPAIVRIGPTLLGMQILVGLIATMAGVLCGAVLGSLSQPAVATITVIIATLVGLVARRARPLKTAATAWTTGCVAGAAIAICVRLVA